LILIGVVFMIIGLIVSGQLKRRFKEYSKIQIASGLTGKEVAEKMLNDNGIYDVQIIEAKGMLSDHYNPANKTVALSPDVFHNNSVAAAAVAAHECGHAVQHANAYRWLQMRSSLVPMVQFSSSIMQWILLGGILLIKTFPYLLFFGILLFGATTLFSIITLPVEFDASKRALVWLNGSRVVSDQQHDKAANALRWAASTYVVAALSSIASLLYLILIYMGRRD
jgi:Zn-dependent membrane protease YugP